MDRETLRKVQLVQLEIAKEIKRICDDNDIRYFLTAGSLLGAVRHKGFIPWDDDLDMGMLLDDYNKFCEVAPKCMDSKYVLQTMETDESYPLTLAKVRKVGTVYVENKANQSDKPGIYVDIIPYKNVPDSFEEAEAIAKKAINIQRVLLMKCGNRPWMEDTKIIWKKRIGYMLYQLIALFVSKDTLVERYHRLFEGFENTNTVAGDMAYSGNKYIDKKWLEEVIPMQFEDTEFSVCTAYKEYLETIYGDYMQLPPEDERENRHQIVEISFGDD